MSLGFEVETTVSVRDAGHQFGTGYKGVTLFRTSKTPGVCAVIETGNMGMASTVELVSHVDKNPYATSSTWRRQVKQLARLGEMLVSCNDETVAAFVASTKDTRFDPTLTQGDIDDRMGPVDRSFWETYLCCCFASTDSRVTAIRNATLRGGGSQFAGSGDVQVNFSSNLRYIGERLGAKEHPFAELVGDGHQSELELVAALTTGHRLHDLFGVLDVDREVLAFIYLVVHRIMCEQGKTPNKNRFLFLHRFDFADVRELLQPEQLRQISEVNRGALLELAANQRQARPPRQDSAFSAAAAMHHVNLAKHGIANTIGEFLDAVLDGHYGQAGRAKMSKYLLRVADSTVPARVEGADNLVFEGRIPDWTALTDVDLDEASSASGMRELLATGLTALGDIVVNYDCAPGQRRRSLDRPRETPSMLVTLDSSDDSDMEGLLKAQPFELNDQL